MSACFLLDVIGVDVSEWVLVCCHVRPCDLVDSDILKEMAASLKLTVRTIRSHLSSLVNQVRRAQVLSLIGGLVHGYGVTDDGPDDADRDALRGVWMYEGGDNGFCANAMYTLSPSYNTKNVFPLMQSGDVSNDCLVACGSGESRVIRLPLRVFRLSARLGFVRHLFKNEHFSTNLFKNRRMSGYRYVFECEHGRVFASEKVIGCSSIDVMPLTHFAKPPPAL